MPDALIGTRTLQTIGNLFTLHQCHTRLQQYFCEEMYCHYRQHPDETSGCEKIGARCIPKMEHFAERIKPVIIRIMQPRYANDAELYYNIGCDCLEKERDAEAIEFFTLAIRDNFRLGEAYIVREICYHRQKKFSLALDDMKIAAALGQKDAALSIKKNPGSPAKTKTNRRGNLGPQNTNARPGRTRTGHFGFSLRYRQYRQVQYRVAHSKTCTKRLLCSNRTTCQ